MFLRLFFPYKGGKDKTQDKYKEYIVLKLVFLTDIF